MDNTDKQIIEEITTLLYYLGTSELQQLKAYMLKVFWSEE